MEVTYNQDEETSSATSKAKNLDVMWAPTHLRKLFIGGIDYTTSDDSLKEHFARWGDVVDAVVMKDPATNRSRGFGFVTYVSPEHVDAAQRARPHKVDGRLVETKRAVPRNETCNTLIHATNSPDAAHTRIFIGGLPQDVKEDDLESYFELFGRVTCVNIMYDKSSGRHRGFAFVDFNDYDPVDKVLLTRNHTVKGRVIDVKKAISKADLSKMKSMFSSVTGTGVDNSIMKAFGVETTGNNAAAGSMQQALGMQFNSLAGSSSNIVNGSLGNSNNAKPGSSSSSSKRGVTQAAFPGASSGTGVLPNMGMGHPFFPPVPMPGFAAQLRAGWQYSLSNNAEVLRNTSSGTSKPESTASESNSDSSGDGMDTDEEDSTTTNWKTSHCLEHCPVAASILVLEPFYGGSHKQLLDTLSDDDSVLSKDTTAIFSLPSKKWHWRARTSALYFSQKIPITHTFKTLFASSTLNLCELVGLRPDLGKLRKVLYFHENQLVYPVQNKKDRDFQYGYNQILSCLAADCIVFNSQYNLDSFLREIPRHLRVQPDHRSDSRRIIEVIRLKAEVLYFPINIISKDRPLKDTSEPLHILWPHRWEHDKDPETFFQVIYQLIEAGGLNFRISVLGESFSDKPAIFQEAQWKLANYIINWGYVSNKQKYWEILHSADVVVSTAHHEFFGVAMLEAVGAGCYPLCPNRLVYPEFFPQECLYNTTQQLKKSLAQWCARPQTVRSKKVNLDLNNFSWNNLRQQYIDVLAN